MNNQYLIHYGVPGMKWGVRKQRKLNRNETTRNYRNNYKQNKATIKAYNKTSDYANKVLIPKINKKYKGKVNFNDPSNPNNNKYLKEYETEFQKVFDKNLADIMK